jgi:serine/threonine protein kinase
VYLLKKIKHSNVIRLLEVFESKKHMLIVMEYAGGGDLLRLIRRKGRLDEGDTKYIFK